MMDDTFIVSVVTFIYFFAAFTYLFAFIFRRKFIERVAFTAAVGGLVIHTAAVMIRWGNSYRMGIGHAPLSNFYESLVFFSWAIIFIYIIARRRIHTMLLGSVASFFSFLILAYASLSGNVSCEIQPLIPALQSNWLISHVISSFLAYACFALAFGSGILYLVRSKAKKDRLVLLPDAGVLDEITYKMISIGFVLLTLGIITGAAWADTAWGRYWGWDPKETWSLITWLIYGAFLHARLVRGWRGVRMSLIAIVGFMAVIFTYLGVNYILSGLHSYL
jgi:cytochrome c-type biogenesis protein CcsB